MKKIKKLTLNKEVVSILGGNDMNMVKGGIYSDQFECNGNGAMGTGGAAPNDAIPAATSYCPVSYNGTCVSCATCGCPPPPLVPDSPLIQDPANLPQVTPTGNSCWSCAGSCFQEMSCYPCGDMGFTGNERYNL